MSTLRAGAIGLLSGLIGGVMWGVGARIAMRIVALAAHQRPEFSIGGTMGILVIGAIFGTPLGLLFASIRRYVPCSTPRAGLLFGGLVLLLVSVPFYLGPLSDESSAGGRILAVALFGSLFVGFGMVVASAHQWLELHMFDEPPRRLYVLPGLSLLIAMIAVGAALVKVITVGFGG